MTADPRRSDAPPPGARPDDTRARLLAAARQVFARAGVQHARMSDVARAAEVSRQALYYHFHSKQALAGELVRSGLDDLGREVRAGLSDGPVEAIVSLLLRFYARNGDLASLLLLQQVDVGLDLARLRDVGHEVLVGPLVERLTADADAGRIGTVEPRTAALAIVGAVNACAVDLLFRDDSADVGPLVAELERYVQRITDAPAPSPSAGSTPPTAHPTSSPIPHQELDR